MCVCGSKFSIGIVEIYQGLLPQLRSAISLGSIAAQYRLQQTENVLRQWIVPVLKRYLFKQLANGFNTLSLVSGESS